VPSASPQCGIGTSDYDEPKKAVRISGQVVDPTNLPLPRTTVRVSPVEAGTPITSVVADDDGRFVFQSVSSQSYLLRFDAPGFLSRRLEIPEGATGHDVDVGVIVLPIGEITEGGFSVKREKRTKPVTVCDALADRNKFNGKPVAIVGRVDCRRSIIDQVCFLAEDRCEQPVTADGYAWPNKVLIVDYWEEGMPRPPSRSVIDQDTLAKKLALVRKSTTLGSHKEPRFKAEDRTSTKSDVADVNDEWGMAYGVVFTTPNLRKDNCGDEIGCGGFDGAPIALITVRNALKKLGGGNNARPKR
jgi:hypothetical protein